MSKQMIDAGIIEDWKGIMRDYPYFALAFQGRIPLLTKDDLEKSIKAAYEEWSNTPEARCNTAYLSCLEESVANDSPVFWERIPQSAKEACRKKRRECLDNAEQKVK